MEERRKAHRRQRPRDFLNVQEQEMLLAASKKGRNGIRDHAMCLLLLGHGYRASELCGMLMSDLDLQYGNAAQIFVRRNKGSRSRMQPVGEETLRALNRWLKMRPDNSGYDTVFLSEQMAPLHRNTLFKLVNTWGERASIAFPVHPHMLRHSCGYRIVNKPGGAKDTRALQDWLGHKNPAHTARYTALSAETFRQLRWGI